MHEERIDLGCCPAEEDAVQVGTPDYARNAKAQCRAYVEAIRAVCGREPEGARLMVAANPHDFGTYYSVEVRYDPANKEAADYAFGCDAKAPTTWEEAGIEPPTSGWQRG